MSNQNDNSGLYFIVGLIVAVVAVMGFIMLSNNDGEIQSIEPAAGIEETVDETSSSFELNVDDDGGVSGTTTQTSE